MYIYFVISQLVSIANKTNYYRKNSKKKSQLGESGQKVSLPFNNQEIFSFTKLLFFLIKIELLLYSLENKT